MTIMDNWREYTISYFQTVIILLDNFRYMIYLLDISSKRDAIREYIANENSKKCFRKNFTLDDPYKMSENDWEYYHEVYCSILKE